MSRKKTKPRPSISKSRKKLPRGRNRAKAKSLLILECDSKRLAEQSLSMADTVRSIMRLVAKESRVEVVKTHIEVELRLQLAALAENNSRFDLILVIGHSNESGLALTSDYHVSWEGFAQWINPFRPKRLVLVACSAGSAHPRESLFAGLVTLQEIYASPEILDKRQSKIVEVLIPYLLKAPTISYDWILAGQTLNCLLSDGSFVLWKRGESEIKNRLFFKLIGIARSVARQE